MSKRKKKVKGRREEKDEEHEHDYLCKQLVDKDGNVIADLDKDMQAVGETLIEYLNDEADLHGHPIEALDQIDKKTENFFDSADYFFELIDTDKERGMVKIRYVIEDWIDKEGAQRLIAKIQSE
ncbi:MAG: hypothetical protein J7K81_09065 [Methanophagales archaeon]|nr:hypothetical protein [Methanophagales archaeon]